MMNDRLFLKVIKEYFVTFELILLLYESTDLQFKKKEVIFNGQVYNIGCVHLLQDSISDSRTKIEHTVRYLELLSSLLNFFRLIWLFLSTY